MRLRPALDAVAFAGSWRHLTPAPLSHCPTGPTGRFISRGVDGSVVPRVLALVVAFLVAMGAIALSAVVAIPGALLAIVLPPAAALAALIALSETAFPAVGYAFTQTGDGAGIDPSWAVPDARGWALVVVATVATVAVNRLVFGLGRLVGVDPVATVSPPEGLTVTGLLVVAPVLLFVVGPAEEYLFRGVLQRYLAKSFSRRGAVLWAAVLFTVVHVPNALLTLPSALLVSGPVWLLVGLAFGWLYETTGTLVVPALVHGLYDVAVFSLLFAEWGVI